MFFKRKPTVSVILASYNHEKYIKKAVESVLYQSFSDLELIVIDDGSTDETANVVEKIHDPRLKLIRLVPNRRHHPRNFGIKIAQVRYIAFQNSDDVWLPDKLRHQMDVMEEKKDVVLCFTRLDLINERGKIIKHCWAHTNLPGSNRNNGEWLKMLFTLGINFGIASALIRTHKLRRLGGFNPSLVQMSDYDLWVRLLGLGQLYIIEKPLTQMRILKGRNFSTPKPDTINRHYLEYPEIFMRYIEWPINKYLNQIFPEVIPSKTKSKALQYAALAKYAWSLNTPHHLLFADRLLSTILAHPQSREEVLNFFGVELLYEYIKHRGEITLGIQQGIS